MSARASDAPQACRIAFVLASDTLGGAERHTLSLAATLAARGHECVIAELDEPVITAHGLVLPKGVGVQATRLGPEPTRPRLFQAYRFLRSLRADVGVFAKGWPEVGTPTLDLACRLAFRGRFLTVEHSSPPSRSPLRRGRHLGGALPGLGLWWYAAGLRVYVRSVFPTQVVTVSEAIARALVDQYWFPDGKVVAIRNGIDGSRFVPDPAARERARAGWGVPRDAVVYGSVGRFQNFIKGHDIAIACFDRLCAANPDRELWLVLVGSGADGPALRAQASASAYAHRIVFPGDTERTWEACCGFDVFLMPSRVEGLGLALLEAMACGCHPVAMGVGGIPEVVADPSVGWLAPPNDSESFLLGMQAALDLGAEGRAAVGVAARRFVLENFRADVQYGKLADFVEQM